MLVRRERVADASAIARVHALAFRDATQSGEPVEVGLVDRLRRSDAWLPRLSLVGVVGDEVLGHVVCTRAAVGPDQQPALGLGPIGVHPDHQGRGLGSALMHAVLGAADASDEPLVGVLGDPGYYRRFGFVPAGDHDIEAPDATWGSYFQVRKLSAYTSVLRGRFTYAQPFREL